MMRSLPAALAAAGLLCTLPAHAGLFDDDVARKQVNDLQKTTSQTLIDQSRQIDQLNRQVSELRGQVEVLNNQITDLDKRQKDLYLDLDNRLQSIEASKGKSVAKPVPPAATDAKAADKSDSKPGTKADSKPADDPGAVLKAYESALGLQGGKYKEAATADKFAKPTPTASKHRCALARQQLLRVGDCKQVISSQQKLLAKWPKNSRAPDAMANIANCQAELGQKSESQKTLKDLVAKYPDSKAAGAAKQQLKK
jgi:TolA-binding protein